MSESPDTTAAYVVADDRDRRLHRVLAWVGIVTGVVVTVAVIFFSGVALGWASGGYHGWHRGYQGGQMKPGNCPMMQGMTGPGGMMGPGGMAGMDPEDMGPKGMGPGMTRPSTPPPGTG